MKKGPDGGEHKEHLDDRPPALGGGRDNHRLADEPAEERHTGDRKRPDRVQHEHQPHAGADPTELGELPLPGRLEGGPGAHEEQRLVENVTKGMRGCTVERACRPDADSRDHIAHLADDVEGEQASDVIFENREHHPVEGHGDPSPAQNLRAWKGADQ